MLKMKAMANSLMAAGQQISDDELILYILGGLGHEFEAIIVNLTSRDSITLQKVQFMLQTHEMRLENLNALKMLDLSNYTSNFSKKFTPSSLPFKGKNHSRGRYKRDRGHYITGGGRGYNQSSSLNKPLCQIYNKIGHTAMKCFYRFDLCYQNPFMS